MLLCVGLTVLAVKMRSLPVIFISSVGWTICGLQIWQQTEEVLPMLLVFMLAVAQFMLINKEGM
jgi:hypothetical protein